MGYIIVCQDRVLRLKVVVWPDFSRACDIMPHIMAGENERTVGQSNIGAEGTAKTPVEVLEQEILQPTFKDSD